MSTTNQDKTTVRERAEYHLQSIPTSGGYSTLQLLTDFASAERKLLCEEIKAELHRYRADCIGDLQLNEETLKQILTSLLTDALEYPFGVNGEGAQCQCWNCCWNHA